jgi:hypothetical protein
MNRYQLVATAINTLWHERVSRLPLGAADLIDEPANDEIAAIVQVVMEAAAPPTALEINGLWVESVSLLPLGAIDLIPTVSDDEIAEVIRKHIQIETARESASGGPPL